MLKKYLQVTVSWKNNYNCGSLSIKRIPAPTSRHNMKFRHKLDSATLTFRRQNSFYSRRHKFWNHEFQTVNYVTGQTRVLQVKLCDFFKFIGIGPVGRP